MFKINKFLALPVVAALFAFAVAGTASAQIAVPQVAVQLLSTGLTPNPGPGTNNDVMAVVRLDTTYSSDAIRISNIPLIISAGNGALASNLHSCTVFNSSNMTAALNTGGNVPSSLSTGLNYLNLDTNFVLPRGTVTTLNVLCNVDPSALVGGTYQVSLNTANVSAVAASTGLPATVTVGVSSPIITNPTGPIGFPNTGAGGQAATNIALILGSLIAATLGVIYAKKAVH